MTKLLSINEETCHGIQVANLLGRLDSTNAHDFEKNLLEAMDRHKVILIDCSQLVFISSAGLRVILMAAKKARQKSSQFALCGINENIYSVFEISGFLRILTVYPSRDTAVASLQNHSPVISQDGKHQ